MRARLKKAQPGLAHHFGIRPWEIELLTPAEIEQFLENLEHIAREQRKQSRRR